MRHFFSFPIFLLLVLSTLSLSCNKSSYIEGVGFTSGPGSTPVVQNGLITLFCTDAGFAFCSSGGLTVKVDGETKGSIRQYSVSQPSCGTNSSSALSISLPAGTYSFTVSGSGTGCPRYSFSYTITRGECKLLNLN